MNKINNLYLILFLTKPLIYLKVLYYIIIIIFIFIISSNRKEISAHKATIVLHPLPWQISPPKGNKEK